MNTAEKQAALAFNHSPVPQMIAGNRLIIQYNLAFGALFGYDEKELKGESLVLLYPSTADYYERGERCLAVLANQNLYEDERFMQHRSREIFWARARGVTLTPQNPFELMVWSFERIRYDQNKTVALTAREQEVATYIANGLTNKQIALELGISVRTIEAHRSRVMKKLGARSTADLVTKFVGINSPRQ